jgi:hypothetical protein
MTLADSQRTALATAEAGTSPAVAETDAMQTDWNGDAWRVLAAFREGLRAELQQSPDIGLAVQRFVHRSVGDMEKTTPAHQLLERLMTVVVYTGVLPRMQVQQGAAESLNVFVPRHAETVADAYSLRFNFGLQAQEVFDYYSIELSRLGVAGQIPETERRTHLLPPPVEGFLLRCFRAVTTSALRMNEDSLMSALAAPTDLSALQAALDDPAFVVDDTKVIDPIAEARARGLERRKALLERCGGLWQASKVAEHLHVSRQAVVKRRTNGKLLAVDVGRNGYQYPACQFTERGVVEGLDTALKALDYDDPWARLKFFLTPDSRLDDRTPMDALRAGDAEAVGHVAAMTGEQGAS